MKSLRSVLVGVAAASLLAFPAAAAIAHASVPAGATSAEPLTAAARRHDTWIRFLSFDHTRGFGTPARIKGQVGARVGGQRGAVAGVRVRLYRKIAGKHSWTFIDRERTTTGRTPHFKFRVRSLANASYRVNFGGSRRLQPSSNRTPIFVYRGFRARMDDGGRKARFHGRVTPKYAHRIIHLERRACAHCGWKGVRTKHTRDRGRWSFRVGAPRSGRWYWRVSTPASKKYIRSYSGVFTTRRR